MFSRKHTVAVIPCRIEDKGKHPTTKGTLSKTFTIFNSSLRYILSVLILFAIFFISLSFYSTCTATIAKPAKLPACKANTSVYVYELPPEFNLGLLHDCSHLNVYTDMCPHVANQGLGRPIFSGSSWFATHQFLAEMIFHARLENHPCRTRDPVRANLFYVPFYGGLHASSKFRESNHTARDELAIRLVEFLKAQPMWQKRNGRDHFLALGRTAWDFMRSNNGNDFGANCLLNIAPVKNMSVMTVERQPWQGHNQFGIPYPSYFHPSTNDQMVAWQKRMTESKRPYLFSFIGGPRKGVEIAAIRDELIKQCEESSFCHLMKCGSQTKCHDPSEVLKVMTESQFCLQAPGDSFTRRSTFDSVLAGCIPVFSSPHMAYTQYKWYFLADYGSEYSVYIDESEILKGKRSIEEALVKISSERVKEMRSKIIEMMPSVTYAHPNSTHVGFEDAVDVALAAMSKHVL